MTLWSRSSFKYLSVGSASLSVEMVKAPEYDYVELLLIGLQQQLLKFGAVGLATRHLLSEYLLKGAVLSGKGPQLVHLILRVLAFTAG